jgi:hypothetical protein
MTQKHHRGAVRRTWPSREQESTARSNYQELFLVRILMDPSSTDSLPFYFPSSCHAKKYQKPIRKITRWLLCWLRFPADSLGGSRRKREGRPVWFCIPLTHDISFSHTDGHHLWILARQHTTHPTVPRVFGPSGTDATTTQGVYPTPCGHTVQQTIEWKFPIGRTI